MRWRWGGPGQSGHLKDQQEEVVMAWLGMEAVGKMIHGFMLYYCNTICYHGYHHCCLDLFHYTVLEPSAMMTVVLCQQYHSHY